MQETTSLPGPVFKHPDELLLDPMNPRLAGHEVELVEQDKIVSWLYKEMAVSELVASIAANGYWRHEELFAEENDGRLVVLEGNRRLCAVKVLVDPKLRARCKITDPPPVAPSLRGSLEALPVILSTRARLWDYIGFKHVNGPRAWDSIAKAQYIYRVHSTLDVPLEKIAGTIGDQHDTVVRLYRGYLVLKQAQDEGLFDPDDSYRPKFPFSHLWTALSSYTSVRKYLGLESDRLDLPNPVPESKLGELRNLLLWLFGSRSDEVEPLVQRQNPDLRRLAGSLDVERGVRKLEAGLPLDIAHDAALGDERLFSDAILNAEEHLREAKRFVATGYDGDEELMETADDILRLAKSLRQEMAHHHEPEGD